MGLKALQAAAERKGVEFKVGEVDADNLTPSVISDDSEGRQPVEIGARVVAHVAYRIPGVRKLTRKFEGDDKRSGIGSDVSALIVNLYERNEDLFNTLIATGLQGFFENLTAKKGATPDVPGPPTGEFIDFGPQSPIGSANNNGHGG